MVARKRTRTPEPAKVEETPAVTEEVVAEETVAEAPAEEAAPEAPAEEPVAEAPTGKEPVEGELHTEEPVSTLKEAQSPESIHDQIRNKLANRHGEKEDLFNPGVSQAVNKSKMEDVAKTQGFELTRGREIGARLIARSRDRNFRP
jgi:hypothetical protein